MDEEQKPLDQTSMAEREIITYVKKAGRHDLVQNFLAKNPKYLEEYNELLKKVGTGTGDINTFEDIAEYIAQEYTRAKNENVLRGKTFSDYSRVFFTMLRLRQQLELEREESEARQRAIFLNRDEVNLVLQKSCEVIAELVEDIELRKKIALKLTQVCDEYHAREQQLLEHTEKKYDNSARRPEEPGK